MWHRLAEPMGLLYGQDALDAVQCGIALPLMGGSVAFTHVRLIDKSYTSCIMPIDSVPAPWQDVLIRLTRVPYTTCLPDGPQVMGILNITPDSFSDGGLHTCIEKILTTVHNMNTAGCLLVDIGGESTRPGATPITPKQEWERIGPVIEILQEKFPHMTLSVDTRHSFVMDRALTAGVHIINDISALQYDPQSLELLTEKECGIVLMHMRGTPQTMDKHVFYNNIAYDVVRELGERINTALAAGISKNRIIIDPGFGFAKTPAQNIELLRRCLLMANLGYRVLFGVSRKRMIGAMTRESQATSRDIGTHIATLSAMPMGAPILRVHDVPGMVQSVRVWQNLYGSSISTY
ncbi:MAG: dihydropteroate synthase [Acetobacter sp.]|nr:dihydropteroate synthase [Acetobacter sp.]